MCKVKGVTCSDRTAEIYHPTFQFPQRFSLFRLVLVICPTALLAHSHHSHQPCLQGQQQAAEKGSQTLTVFYLPSTKQQANKVSD